MTVQLATERDARREVARARKRRAYSGPGFGPRSFECLGIGVGIGIDVGDGAVGTPGVINLANYFSGVAMHVQTDLGFTYGGTLHATTGNTSTTVVTQTGAPSTKTIPLRAKATNTVSIGSGAQFSIYADGGTTPFMTSVTPTAATPVALTGVGTGASLTWSAGTSVTNDTWDATCSGLGDQSGNGKDATQGTASAQPLVAVGVNGIASIGFDGAAHQLRSLVSLGTPGATPYKYYLVMRITGTNAAAAFIVSGTGGTAGCLYLPTGGSTSIAEYSGSAVNSDSHAVSGTWYAIQAGFGNATTDFVQIGTNSPTTGAAAGNLGTADRNIGSQNGANFAKMELLSCTFYTGGSSGISSAVATKYAGLINA